MDSLATLAACAVTGRRDVSYRAAHAPVDVAWLVTFLPALACRSGPPSWTGERTPGRTPSTVTRSVPSTCPTPCRTPRLRCPTHPQALSWSRIRTIAVELVRNDRQVAGSRIAAAMRKH